MASDDQAPPPPDLMHPELLSKDELVTIMTARAIEVENMKSLEKSILVDLFYKNIIPMPQRKYRNNRKGRELTRKQILQAKRKRTHDESNTGDQQAKSSTAQNSNSRFLCSFDLPKSSAPKGDRLKPPPSAVNPERKIIRLNSNTTTNANNGSASQVSKPGVIRLGSSSSSSNVTGNTQISTVVVKKTLAQSSSDKVKMPQTSTDSNKAAVKSPVLVTNSSPKMDDSIAAVRESETGVKITKIIPRVCADKLEGGKRQRIKLNRSSVLETVHSKVTEDLEPEKMESKSPTPAESPSPTTEEAVVRKKFKGISVKWP